MDFKTLSQKKEFHDNPDGNALQDLPKEYVEQLEKKHRIFKTIVSWI